MGKVSHKYKTSLKSKQKLHVTIGQICNSKASMLASVSCLDLGKKRVAVLDGEKAGCSRLCQNKSSDETPVVLSPDRLRCGHVVGYVDLLKENNLQRTPPSDEGKAGYESMQLESLPMELLVKILCHLHHDQLRAVFHVSERIRTAVTIARKLHFNYTTPDRSRQEMLNTMTPLPTQRWPFVRKENEKRKVTTLPRTPKAPRHGPRPPSRLKYIEMSQVAAVLFQESSISPRHIVPSGLPKPICKPFSSNRVLFDEELELCHAVAQNKLR
ncbi:hypothetical protein QVD17_07099 [Tagetes erecta]|uniref:F-box domain-containing protein n=1 Tax=Tagetes erecta TaxID=13708 RepID=A0AAD8P758_TARER|nr:hypothetical protein QVD17_07099 [Tagetes erecta]